MSIDSVQMTFDYGALDEQTRVFVQEKAQAIHARLKRTAVDIIDIGQDFTDVKARLQHGQYEKWLDSEFGMSLQTARNFIHVARRFGGKSTNFVDFPVSVLYELAAPSTPDTVIEQVETGQIAPTLPAIRDAKREYQQPTPESKAFFEQWQRDNLALGLDRFADPLPKSEEDEIEYSHQLTEEDRFMAQVEAGTVEYSRDGHTLVKELDAREKRNGHVMQVMGSSDSPEWYTPQEIVRLSVALLGKIDLDPCSNSRETPSVPARTLYTKADDGLSQAWAGKTYLNPPYGSEIPQWVEKLVQSYQQGAVTEAVALLPARIDTQWFQPLYEEPDCSMCHVRGRIQFENSPHHAPFPCVIVYLGKRVDAFVETFKHKGPIMRRIG